MKKEFKDYLRKINKTERVIEHIEKIYDEYKILLPSEEIIDIFLCEDYNKEGIKEDISILFITENNILEAKDFILNERDLDYSNYIKRFTYFNILYKDTNLKEYNEKSWIKLKVKLDYDVYLLLTAIGNNCEDLMRIFINYIKPNLIN